MTFSAQVLNPGPFPPVIAPHTFVRKIPKVLTPWEEMTPEQQEFFGPHKNTILGDESECAAFGSFAQLFRQPKYESYRIFSLNGVEFLFPNENSTDGIVGEFDQVFIAQSIRTVMYIEYKVTFSAKHAQKKKQFERFKKLLQSHFPMGDGWRLVFCYGFSRYPDYNGKALPCKNCSPFTFLVNDRAALEEWFDCLLAKLAQEDQGWHIAYLKYDQF